MPHAVDLGYVVENKTYPNGSVIFVVKVPFGDQHVVIQVLYFFVQASGLAITIQYRHILGT